MHTMHTILIIEDQKEQVIFLSKQLQSISSDFKILTSFSIKEAYDIAVRENVDLFFMDIGLPDGSGLDLALKIREIKKYELSWIVFLTSYSEHILDAFQNAHCYDYLIKPYSSQKIMEITKKLTSSSNTQRKDIISYVSFEMKGIILKININDILFVEVFNKNCTIHTYRKKFIIKKTPLKKMLDMLPQDIFLQCHRSYAVNINFVEAIEKTDNSWEIIFKDYKEKAILGETFKSSFINKLNVGIIE